MVTGHWLSPSRYGGRAKKPKHLKVSCARPAAHVTGLVGSFKSTVSFSSEAVLYLVFAGGGNLFSGGDAGPHARFSRRPRFSGHEMAGAAHIDHDHMQILLPSFHYRQQQQSYEQQAYHSNYFQHAAPPSLGLPISPPPQMHAFQPYTPLQHITMTPLSSSSPLSPVEDISCGQRKRRNPFGEISPLQRKVHVWDRPPDDVVHGSGNLAYVLRAWGVVKEKGGRRTKLKEERGV